jgi:hypothetical protein
MNDVPNLVPAPHPKHKNLVPIVFMGVALIAVLAFFAWSLTIPK